MSMQFRLPRPAVASRLKKSRGPIVAALVAALVMVPSAASGNYSDPAGDSGAAGDITSVTVVGDKTSGQLVFRISGSNLATGFENPVWLSIDSDSNPLTGDLTDHGTDYWFGVGGHTYGFQRWNGSDWVDTPYATVHVSGSTSQVMISVNRSELGNASALNFIASTFSGPTASTSGIVLAPSDRAEAASRRPYDRDSCSAGELLVHCKARREAARRQRYGRLHLRRPEEEGSR